jgi:hypothetical protein
MKSNPLPEYEDFIKQLEQSLEYLKTIDDVGSYHFELSRWQELFVNMKPILDENGGI